MSIYLFNIKNDLDRLEIRPMWFLFLRSFNNKVNAFISLIERFKPCPPTGCKECADSPTRNLLATINFLETLRAKGKTSGLLYNESISIPLGSRVDTLSRNKEVGNVIRFSQIEGPSFQRHLNPLLICDLGH